MKYCILIHWEMPGLNPQYNLMDRVFDSLAAANAALNPQDICHYLGQTYGSEHDMRQILLDAQVMELRQ